MDDRLGLDLPRDAWPTPRLVAAYEEAGLRWLQVRTPPRGVLSEPSAGLRHARALRAVLATSGLRLVLHAPDDLSAGVEAHDRAFAGLLEYAAETGAEYVAYHGLNFVDVDGPARSLVRERASLEEASLHGLFQRAHTLGVRIAVENLAPVYPGPARLSYDPLAVRDLVRRLASPAAGMLLDLGHLHITADASRDDPAAIAAALAPDVVLWHVHDNLGARRRDLEAPGLEPVRLDLHLAPGSGTLPWPRVASLLAEHPAPLMLEVHPSRRPPLAALVAATRGALGHARAPVAT
jgi:sugar phosphate isomerase/epimerase